MKRQCVLILFAVISAAHAQFSPMLLQNASYWGDGKAEFDIYNAQLMRDGQLRQCEMLVILTPQLVDAATLTLANDPKQAGLLPTIRMNEIATVPRGLFVEQLSVAALWRMDSMSLARLDFAGTDSIGNIAKRVEEKREANASHWTYAVRSYRENIDSKPLSATTGTALFYDEIPLRIRTIDFSKASGGFDIQLAQSIANAGKESVEFKTAKLSWKIDDRNIEVTLQHAGGTDVLKLDRDFPFLMREWRMADGSSLKIKRSLKADYWNYGKNGDREKALNNPMLQHPD